MRPAPALMQLAVCLSSLTPLTAAWPGWIPDINALVVRAETTEATETSAAEETSTVTDDEATATSTEAAETTKTGKNAKTTNLNTAKADDDEETGTGTKTGTATETGKSKTTGKKGSKETHKTFAANDPPASITMLTPATTMQATPLYKISDHITFAWNYTNLQGTPSAVDVLASCSAASETWTLTANMSFNSKPTYVWDTKEQANNPESALLVELYTLIIKDSESEVTDVAEPGYLGAYSGLKFGLYTGQPYQNRTEWEQTYDNAAPAIDHQALGFVLTMTTITVVSFTWFVTGLGLN